MQREVQRRRRRKKSDRVANAEAASSVRVRSCSKLRSTAALKRSQRYDTVLEFPSHALVCVLVSVRFCRAIAQRWFLDFFSSLRMRRARVVRASRPSCCVVCPSFFVAASDSSPSSESASERSGARTFGLARRAESECGAARRAQQRRGKRPNRNRIQARPTETALALRSQARTRCRCARPPASASRHPFPSAASLLLHSTRLSFIHSMSFMRALTAKARNAAPARMQTATAVQQTMRPAAAVAVRSMHAVAAAQRSIRAPRTVAAVFGWSRAESRRMLSTAAAAPTTAAAAAPTSTTAPPPFEIKLMAHYVGAPALSALHVPSSVAARAWRFTQPSSLLIPLDTGLTSVPTAASSATATAVGSSRPAEESVPLSSLFNLPPIPVAPIVRIPAASSTPASNAANLPASSSLLFDPTAPFMVAFQYGAVVFFNVNEAIQQEIMNRLGQTGAKLKDDYKIVLSADPYGSSFSCKFLTDSVQVTSMDLNSVRIFSQILSQAVALQHYESEANRLLLKLRAMLRPEDRLTGVTTMGHTRSNLIVNYVAESSTAMVDVLTELKLLDRSEIVWSVRRRVRSALG